MSFKEKFNSGKEKVKVFWREHKGTICKVTLATGAVVYLGKKIYDGYTQNDNDEAECNFEIVDNLEPFEKPAEEWPEGMLEQYYKVKEFAETLDLKEGECYYIDDSKQYALNDWYKGRMDGKPIVSHLINGEGLYPEDKE